MTTEAFLNALKRFTYRTGLYKIIYSKKGKNFGEANIELKDVLRKLNEYPKNQTIENHLFDK